jgi:hypothetical protein
MRASIPTRQLRSRRNLRVRSCSSRALPGVPVRCSPTRFTPNAAIAWSLAAVPNPAVSDHRPGRPTGDTDDSLDGGHELGSVGRVALVELVVGDEAALVLGYQQGVAELGRRSRLALADRPGARVREQHQPVGDHPVAGQPLVGLGQQPLGGGARPPRRTPTRRVARGDRLTQVAKRRREIEAAWMAGSWESTSATPGSRQTCPGALAVRRSGD